jgi:hypothetical protein
MAVIAVAWLLAIGFAAMQTLSASGEEDAALSNAAGTPSDFVMSGGLIPDSDTAASSASAFARTNAMPTLVARARKN